MSEMPPDQMDPVLNLLNQRPPEDWDWAFEPEENSHSAVNAVALANLSILTYSDQAGVDKFLEKWSFQAREHLRGFDTQGFVARKGDCLFVAFRGTEPINIHDWLSDVNYNQRKLRPFVPGRPVSAVPGAVHGGFARALEETLTLQPLTFLEAIEKVGAGTTRLYVTGHSLGGALAILASAVLHFEAGREIHGIYTYGQPRVGDTEFSKAFDAQLQAVTFRYVNDLDIVPHVPPVDLPRPVGPSLLNIVQHIRDVLVPEVFAHVGNLKLLLADGTVTDDAGLWNDREVTYAGSIAGFFGELPHLMQVKAAQLLREQERILDHDPVNGYLPKLRALVPG